MDQALQTWFNNNVKWAGNEHTNKSTRRGYTPEIIVDHITEGSAQSCIEWFTSPNNTESSAHFLVTKVGKVYQFVAIEDMSWNAGLKQEAIPKAKAEIVRSKGVNPNWYAVGIEHEGVYATTHGALTAEQLAADLMLHKYIIAYVKDKFNKVIPPDRQHILGHYEIDPVRKPNCPGEKYPLDYIVIELARKVITMNDDWKTVLKKSAANPAEWENAINVAVEAAKAEGNLGALEIFKFLPDLLVKVAQTYNKQ